jgi:hypothetical protein
VQQNSILAARPSSDDSSMIRPATRSAAIAMASPMRAVGERHVSSLYVESPSLKRKVCVEWLSV